MSKALLKIDEFFTFTFAATSHALKAEKVLKESGTDFLMIPTLREISSSCGLSVKIAPDNLDNCQNVLSANNLKYEGLYQVKKDNRKYTVKEIDSSSLNHENGERDTDGRNK